MGRGTDVLKLLGSKALDGVKAGGSVIGKEIDKGLEEQKRKNQVYNEEFEKELEKAKLEKRADQDNALRKKARLDARKKVRGK